VTLPVVLIDSGLKSGFEVGVGVGSPLGAFPLAGSA
jgi:hypothetical protein